MANEHSADKVDVAKIMYKQGYTQERISQVLGIAVKTVRAWAKKYAWEETFGKWELVESNTLELILYQSMALRKKKDRLLKEGAADSENYELLSRGDIDALQKLSTIFHNDVKDFATHSKVAQELLEFISSKNINIAKDVMPIFNEYLTVKQKVYK